MSNSTRIAERQRTDTSSPMPVDAVRDLLATVRALEARVAVLEDLLASAITPQALTYDADFVSQLKQAKTEGTVRNIGELMAFLGDGGTTVGPARTPSDALSAALRLPTVPDVYGR